MVKMTIIKVIKKDFKITNKVNFNSVKQDDSKFIKELYFIIKNLFIILVIGLNKQDFTKFIESFNFVKIIEEFENFIVKLIKLLIIV